ncbi:MAG TPA: hypothetical protein VIX15_16920 [Streptosporangiaceae bacterium]
MNTVEDRLRDALRERADHSPVSTGAWERVLTRTRRRRAFRLGGHARSARYVIPALAAAAVAGVIIVANVIAGQLPSPSATPGGGGIRPSTPSPSASGPSPQLGVGRLSAQVPPRAVLSYQYSPEGKKIVASFWLGYRNQKFWFGNVSPGLQLCSAVFSIYTTQQPEHGTAGPEQPVTDGSGQAFCRAAPQLAAGQVVQVTGGLNAGDGSGAFATLSTRSGIAAAPVASVTAVLPDGRTFAGVVGTGRGFTFKVWSVTYPPQGVVRLVFRDPSGHELASLTRPAVPALLVPPPAARPGSGAVIFLVAGSSIRAYLVDGHVGFWTVPSGWYAYAPLQTTGIISGYRADRGPALAGLLIPSGRIGQGTAQDPFRPVSEFVGYADAGVAKVVLRVHGTHGWTQLTASTLRTNWPGTTVRLWYVAAPAHAYYDTSSDVATAYNAAGQVVAVVHLGTQA